MLHLCKHTVDFGGIVTAAVALAQYAGNGWDAHKKATLFHHKPRARANQKADMNEQERKLKQNGGHSGTRGRWLRITDLVCSPSSAPAARLFFSDTEDGMALSSDDK